MLSAKLQQYIPPRSSTNYTQGVQDNTLSMATRKTGPHGFLPMPKCCTLVQPCASWGFESFGVNTVAGATTANASSSTPMHSHHASCP